MTSMTPTLDVLRQQAARNPEIAQVVTWTEQVEMCAQRDSPDKIIRVLLAMDIVSPNRCNCTEEEKRGWRHQHHRLFNRVMREALGKSLGAVRRILRKDATEGPELHKDIPRLGEFADKDYEQELVDLFLADDPSEEWVGRIVPHSDIELMAAA